MFFGAVFCFCLAGGLSATRLQAETSEGSLAVWSQAQGSEYPVLLSRYKDGEWSSPEKLSFNNRLNLVPSVTSGQGDENWVVWSTVEGEQTNLYFKYFRNGTWSEEKKIETGFTSNTAPSIAVDADGVVWLAWAAFDGQDDEIYITNWNGTTFTPPQRISDNQVPDILPIMSFDSTSKQLAVEWQGYAAGTYSSFQSNYSHGKWSQASEVSEVKEQVSTSSATAMNMMQLNRPANESVEVDLPEFLLSQPSLSLHIKGKAVQSMPARLLQMENE